MKVKSNIRAGQTRATDPIAIHNGTKSGSNSGGVKSVKTTGGRCAGY